MLDKNKFYFHSCYFNVSTKFTLISYCCFCYSEQKYLFLLQTVLLLEAGIWILHSDAW